MRIYVYERAENKKEIIVSNLIDSFENIVEKLFLFIWSYVYYKKQILKKYCIPFGAIYHQAWIISTIAGIVLQKHSWVSMKYKMGISKVQMIKLSLISNGFSIFTINCKYFVWDRKSTPVKRYPRRNGNNYFYFIYFVLYCLFRVGSRFFFKWIRHCF